MKRTFHDTALPVPNPDDWLARAEAMRLLGIGSHVTLARMVRSGALTVYRPAGDGPPMYWRAEVLELAAARARVAGAVA
jgi:hypothetical protein